MPSEVVAYIVALLISWACLVGSLWAAHKTRTSNPVEPPGNYGVFALFCCGAIAIVCLIYWLGAPDTPMDVWHVLGAVFGDILVGFLTLVCLYAWDGHEAGHAQQHEASTHQAIDATLEQLTPYITARISKE